MASRIKKVSKFSEDAIDIALRSLPSDQRESFQRGLDALNAILGEKKPRTSKATSTKTVTDEEAFHKLIIPQIQRKLSETETKEMTTNIKIDLDVNIKMCFEDKTDVKRIKTEHIKMLHLEENVQNLTLIIRFARGKLYLSLLEMHKKAGTSFKEFVELELKVSYLTVLRYMVLANIILRYPRIVFCYLSFAQILVHKTRLLAYLQSDEGLALGKKLSLGFELNAQGQPITIGHIDTIHHRS